MLDAVRTDDAVLVRAVEEWIPTASTRAVRRSRTIGTGPHVCPGMRGARADMASGVRTLLDLLGGVIFGARISLEVSLGAVALGLAVGGIVGVVAGSFRGRVDFLSSLVADSVLAFPPLILLLAVVAAVRPDARSIALAVVTIPTLIRLARANTLAVAEREHVIAAKAMGATDRRMVLRELVPNVLRPLLADAFPSWPCSSSPRRRRAHLASAS